MFSIGGKYYSLSIKLEPRDRNAVRTMNNQLIEKLIKYSSDSCPQFNFENPLLDINVSRALAKSLVKILQDSRGDSTVNINLRRSVLENIRKLCTVEPENHIKLTDDFTEMISESYEKKLNSLSPVDKMLDEFLIKNSLEDNIKSRFENSLSPESIRALLNLDPRNLDVLSKDIIHWNANDERYYSVLKDLWYNNLSDLNKESINNLCIKVKPEIEKIVLEQTLAVLENKDLDEIFSVSSFENVVKTSAISTICFQICIGTLNRVLIACNLDKIILDFIQRFVSEVKKNCVYMSTLYPLQLSNAALFLNIDLTCMPKDVKDKYVGHAIEYIKKVHKESEYDLILLLSHYPQWFDIYFHSTNERSEGEQN